MKNPSIPAPDRPLQSSPQVEKLTLKKFKSKESNSVKESIHSLRTNPKSEKETAQTNESKLTSTVRVLTLLTRDLGDSQGPPVLSGSSPLENLRKNKSVQLMQRRNPRRFSSLQKQHQTTEIKVKRERLKGRVLHVQEITRALQNEPKEIIEKQLRPFLVDFLARKISLVSKDLLKLMGKIEAALGARETGIILNGSHRGSSQKPNNCFADVFKGKSVAEIEGMRLPGLFRSFKSREFVKIFKRFGKIEIKGSAPAKGDLQVFDAFFDMQGGLGKIKKKRKVFNFSQIDNQSNFSRFLIIVDIIGTVVDCETILRISDILSLESPQKSNFCTSFQIILVNILRIIVNEHNRLKPGEKRARKQNLFDHVHDFISESTSFGLKHPHFQNFEQESASLRNLTKWVSPRKKRVSVGPQVLALTRDFPICHFLANFLKLSSANPRIQDFETEKYAIRSFHQMHWVLKGSSLNTNAFLLVSSLRYLFLLQRETSDKQAFVYYILEQYLSRSFLIFFKL